MWSAAEGFGDLRGVRETELVNRLDRLGAWGPGWCHRMLESSPFALLIADVSSGVIAWGNARAIRLFGYRPKELAGMPIERLIPERLRGEHRRHRTEYAADPQVRPMGSGLELSAVAKDGREFLVEVSLNPFQTPAGTLVAVSVQDISASRAAEQRIRELADIVETAHDAISASTLDGVITSWNPSAEALYGYPAEEMLGRHVSILAPPGLKEEPTKVLSRIAQGEQIERMETQRLTRDGRLIAIEATYSPIRNQHGVIVGASAIVRDITQQKRAEAELTRLYEDQRRVALTLQRSLLGTPSQVPGMTLASRYLPGNQGADEIGGDWFDVVALGAGRTALIIGDVMGRGLEAAAVMGQLRSAARALLKTGMQPRRMMRFLDGLVAETPELLVTCCCILMEPEGEIRVCSAGHLPVLQVDPDGVVTRLGMKSGVPLGVGGVPHDEVRQRIRPGTVLILYTDGLVETRHSDLGSQIDRLLRAVQDTAVRHLTLEESADILLEEMLPDEGPEDDMTLLLVRTPPAPLATTSTVLSSGVGAVPAGRRFLTSTLDLWGCSKVDDTARLLVSELLSNAVRHGMGPLALRMRRTSRDLTVEVTDHSMRLPQPRLAGPEDESGRGLGLVDMLSESWGTTPTDDGKTVWFTLPL